MSLKFLGTESKDYTKSILGDPFLMKFVNKMMVGGKKSKSLKILANALFLLESEHGQKEPILFFKNVLESLRPIYGLFSKKIGGANYKIPFKLKENTALSMALKSLITYARANKDGKPMAKKLVQEILETQSKTSESFKHLEELNKSVEMNRAFSHLR